MLVISLFSSMRRRKFTRIYRYTDVKKVYLPGVLGAILSLSTRSALRESITKRNCSCLIRLFSSATQHVIRHVMAGGADEMP